MKKNSKEKESLSSIGSTQEVVDDQNLCHLIAQKAYELYQKRGCAHGQDLEDWLEAERLILADCKAQRNTKPRALPRRRAEHNTGS